MKNVLLAGSLGLSAAHLVRRLASLGIPVRTRAVPSEDPGDIDVLYHFPDPESPRLARGCLEMLEANRRMRLVHVSSAYVAGTRQGLFTEFDLECGQFFHDAWERAHYELERRLRASPARERITIVRPSLVLGDSGDGYASEFTGCYRLLRRLRRQLPICGDAAGRLDVVPADYLAGILIGAGGLPGRTLHAVAGWDASLPLDDFVRLAAGRRLPLLPPVMAPLFGLGLAAAARPALRHSPVFDTWFTRRAVPVTFPPIRSWLGKVIEFAGSRGWRDSAAPFAPEPAVEPATAL